MAELIHGLGAELTLVIIEHDMDLVLNLVDHVTCLHNGRVVADESPASIRQNATIQSIYLGAGQAC
jgi:branched-chain amino acid transport system ATP-binding protein